MVPFKGEDQCFSTWNRFTHLPISKEPRDFYSWKCSCCEWETIQAQVLCMRSLFQCISINGATRPTSKYLPKMIFLTLDCENIYLSKNYDVARLPISNALKQALCGTNISQFSWSLLPNRTMATFLKCHHSFRYKMITTCLSECPQVENWNIPFQFLYFSSTTLTVFPVLQARVMPVYKLAQSIFTVLSAGRHSWHIFHTLFKIME